MPRKSTEQETFLGYEVEFLSNEPKKAAYHLYGKRGAKYTLFRNQHDPDLLYAVNRNGFVVALKGNSWFTDRKGYLQAVYYFK